MCVVVVVGVAVVRVGAKGGDDARRRAGGGHRLMIRVLVLIGKVLRLLGARIRVDSLMLVLRLLMLRRMLLNLRLVLTALQHAPDGGERIVLVLRSHDLLVCRLFESCG